jgi:hypothetical protein
MFFLLPSYAAVLSRKGHFLERKSLFKDNSMNAAFLEIFYSSPSAIVFPVARLARELHKLGVWLLGRHYIHLFYTTSMAANYISTPQELKHVEIISVWKRGSEVEKFFSMELL